MDRRDFLKASMATAGLACLSDWQALYAMGKRDITVGRPWRGWKKGQFQVHFIYTGVSESMFLIFPDGTTMLLDCGDHNAIGRGKLAVPVLPDADRHAGEWIARYVQRVNPNGNDVDYMMLSHYHSDHGGCESFNAGIVERDGRPYALSGFSHAAEYLNFAKAIDRAWPDYNDPIPLKDKSADCVSHMKSFFSYMTKHRGMEVEKFEVGATDQIRMIRKPARYPEFSIRNICGNGRIAYQDGTIKDLYEGRKEGIEHLNENGMSLGMMFTYGKFKFFTAGDFSDKWKLGDGSTFWTEDALGEACGEATVAKINHHGHRSMPEGIVSALKSRVYVSCVWDQLHNLPEVMERISDKSLYPGERIVCPGIMPKERREEDKDCAWMSDIAESSFEGGHIILNVEMGGEDYSITYLTAADESMTVRSVMKFKV